MAIRVLLAEDNDTLALTLGKFLSARGYAITIAATGTEALQLLASTDVDLLLLDLRLPGVGGIEILQKLRKSPKAALPVIIMTGVYKGGQYATEAVKLGVRHYLEKPFTPQALVEAMEDVLRQQKQPSSATTPSTRRSPAINEIYLQKLNGTLEGGSGSPIVFLGGEPVSFLTRERDDFASFLVERGKISIDDLKMFIAQKEGRLFFTQTGLLTYDELVEEGRYFLMKRLLLAASSTTTTFTEGTPSPEHPLVSLAFPQFLYEAYHNGHLAVDPERFLSSFGSLFPSRTPLFHRLINLVALATNDINLLAAIDGQRTMEQLVAGNVDRIKLIAFLQAMTMITFQQKPTKQPAPDFPLKNEFNAPLAEGIVEDETAVDFEDLVEEIAENVNLNVQMKVEAPLTSDEINFEQAVLRDHGFLKGKNYYEIFGLTRNTFSFDKLKEAYFKKSKEYSPEKFMMLSGNTQHLAEEILSTLSNAYNTLSNVVSKERYDEMLNADKVGLDGKQDDRLQAQVQLQSGKVFLEMNEFENALKALQDAYSLNPNNHEACAYLGWATYRNPVNRGSKAAKDKARSLLNRSIQLKSSADALAFRGWMLLEEGRDELAESEFQKALRLNPRELQAKRGMAQLTEKREAEKKGIFKKFFG